MTAKHLCLLLLAVVAVGAVVAQNEDDLPIPVENDNQFPPDNQAEPDFENSAIQESEEPVPLEEIEPTNQLLTEVDTPTTDETSCPDKCLCNFEADDFITDCSGQQLTEFPSVLDPKTTKLKIQNNKLTEIPKQISSLTKLKYLNASNNSIMDLTSGSISELPELILLDLSNNRLIEYPKDLKISFDLTKLEELNLAGNDIRVPLESETLEKFTSLEKLTLPSGAFQEQLEVSLCQSLKESLKVICIESCYDKELSCTSVTDNVDMENEMLYVIPGALISDIDKEDDGYPIMDSVNDSDASDLNSKANDMPDGDSEIKAIEIGRMISDNIGEENDEDLKMSSVKDSDATDLKPEDDIIAEIGETTESDAEIKESEIGNGFVGSENYGDPTTDSGNENGETIEGDSEIKASGTGVIINNNVGEEDAGDPTKDLVNFNVVTDLKSESNNTPEEIENTVESDSEIKASATGAVVLDSVNNNGAIDIESKDNIPPQASSETNEGVLEIKATETRDPTKDNDATNSQPGDNTVPLENVEKTEGDSETNASEPPHGGTNSASEFSLRSAVVQDSVAAEAAEKGLTGNIEEPMAVSKFNTLVEAPKEESNVSESPKTEEPVAISKLNSVVDTPKQESESTKLDKSAAESDTDESYKVGAKTSERKTGGVDKSVIGIIVAGMVLVVAGITIKKNWSSIRRRFSSNSRTPNDRAASNANGTTPEEVPLQDKSPV